MRRTATAADVLRCLLVVAVLLVVCKGQAVGRAAEGMQPGLERDLVAAVGGPTGWVAERLPFAAATDQVTGWLSPDEDLGSEDGAFTAAGTGAGPSRVPPQAFAPEDLGEPASRPPLRSVLVTGDSMSQPLDAELARRLASRRVRTTRDPHLGTGISKSFLVDWGKLSAQQTRRYRPDAVVVFLGANEGFPMEVSGREVACCQAPWAAEYATRVRAVMDAYRAGGSTQVYWVSIPAPRDAGRARVARAVNAAVRVAAGAYGAQVQVVDAAALFTPGGRFRAAMDVGGRSQIVRDPDGIHLNALGAGVLADAMLRDLRRRFTPAGDA